MASTRICDFYKDLSNHQLNAQLPLLHHLSEDSEETIRLKTRWLVCSGGGYCSRKIAYSREGCLFCGVYSSKASFLMPASNTTSEHYFLSPQMNKIYLWSTMTQEQLNFVLMVLHIHKTITNNLDLTAITRELPAGRERAFGDFYQ